MLKVLQAWLQQFMNRESPDTQNVFRKAEETEIIANICWIIERAREFQKNINFCFIDYVKDFTVWITRNCGKFLKRWLCPITLPVSWETGICLLYMDQEATVRTEHGTTNWFQIGKGVHQGCMLPPCLFNFYAEYIMWHARLDEAQARIKIARRRYQ